MADMVRVRPRTGIILDGIPAKGADIPKALADEWLANRLVVRIEPFHIEAKPINTAIKQRKRRSR